MARNTNNKEIDSAYMLMRSYVEYEYKLSRTFREDKDAEKEIQRRLARMFS